MDERALTNAQAFAAWGFGVFSVWGINDGICRCPKGAACTSPGKHPIPIDGLKSATTNEEAVARMLAAAGSGGQYGVVPAPEVIVLDVDGPGWMEKLRTLALPKTLAVKTANGVHLYFHWPESHGPQPTRLFEWVVRSQEHPGYVIGPGSVHQTGVEYEVAHANGHDMHEMIATIATFPIDRVPVTPTESITISQGLRPPEQVPVGGRHDYLRDRARTLRGGGLTGEDLFTAVSALNARLSEPKSDEEVRRAIGDVETKFGEDALPPAPHQPASAASSVPLTDLFVSVVDYRAANSAPIEWVSPLAAYGQVSLVSGPPKCGKSTLIGNLLAARETNSVFLWGDPVPSGPTALVTEESGYPVVRKVEGLNALDILDYATFINAGLFSLPHLIETMTTWWEAQEGRALVVIDTLAVWGDIKDENDSVAANKAVIALSAWATNTGAAVVLAHHARKGGGEHGEAIRGSNAIFGAVAHSVEMSYPITAAGDGRKLSIHGRLDFPDDALLEFDRDTMAYSLSSTPLVDEYPLDQFPMDGSGSDGLRRADVEGVWSVGTAAANKRLKTLVDEKRLVRRDVRTPGEKVTHAEYWKTRPLLVLDSRPTGERMADLIKGKDDA